MYLYTQLYTVTVIHFIHYIHSLGFNLKQKQILIGTVGVRKVSFTADIYIKIWIGTIVYKLYREAIKMYLMFLCVICVFVY